MSITRRRPSLSERAEAAIAVAAVVTGYEPRPLGVRDERGVRGLACYLMKRTGASWSEISKEIYGHWSHGAAHYGASRWEGKRESQDALAEYQARLEKVTR